MRRAVQCRECNRLRPHAAHGLCWGCYARARRQDPEVAQRDRAVSRAWKAANPDRRRAYGRTYIATHAAACARCGQRTRAVDATLCRDCYLRETRKQSRERYEAICAMWADGLTIREVADALGTTPHAIGVTIVRLRQQGYDLPYRYRTRAGAPT